MTNRLKNQTKSLIYSNFKDQKRIQDQNPKILFKILESNEKNECRFPQKLKKTSKDYKYESTRQLQKKISLQNNFKPIQRYTSNQMKSFDRKSKQNYGFPNSLKRLNQDQLNSQILADSTNLNKSYLNDSIGKIKSNKKGEIQNNKNIELKRASKYQLAREEDKKLQLMSETLDMIIERCNSKDRKIQQLQEDQYRIDSKIVSKGNGNEAIILARQTTKQKTYECKINKQNPILRQTVLKNQKLLQQVKNVIIQEDSQQISSKENSFILPYLTNIFSVLDSKKMGILDKQNCSTSEIGQQLQYVLGGLFSKIKYQRAKYNIQQFVQQAQILMADLDATQMRHMIKKSQIKGIKLETKRSVQFSLDSHDRVEEKSILLNKYQFNQIQSSQRKKEKKQFSNKIFKQPYLDEHSTILQYQQQSQYLPSENSQTDISNCIKLSNLPYFQIQTPINQKYINQSQLKEQQNKQKNNQYLQNNFQKNTKLQSLNNKLTEYINKMVITNLGEPQLEFTQLSKHLYL